MKSILLVLLLAITNIAIAQKPAKWQTITVKTSALCGECETRIENKLNYTKGIKYADLDIDSKVVTVKFKTKLLSADAIKKIIASVGYHADEVERDSEAFKSLPDCCQDPNATCTKK